MTKQLTAANDNNARLVQEKDALTKDKTDLASIAISLNCIIDANQDLAGQLRNKLEGLRERSKIPD